MTPARNEEKALDALIVLHRQDSAAAAGHERGIPEMWRLGGMHGLDNRNVTGRECSKGFGERAISEMAAASGKTMKNNQADIENRFILLENTARIKADKPSGSGD